jgi:hypothetical protein
MRKDINLGRGGAQRGGLVALICFASLSFVLLAFAFLVCALLGLVRNFDLLFLSFGRLRLEDSRIGGGSGLSGFGCVGDLGYVIRCLIRSECIGLHLVESCLLAAGLLPRFRKRRSGWRQRLRTSLKVRLEYSVATFVDIAITALAALSLVLLRGR